MTSLHLTSLYPEKPLHVILSDAKNLFRSSNYEILRRLAPQNDNHKHGFLMKTN